MPDDKPKRFQRTLWDIHKRWGQQSLTPLNALGRSDASTVIRSGIPALDALFGESGIPRGKISEILGVPTAGMTTLALKLAAHAQHGQNAVAYIDLFSTFDPDYALRCGVTLERLLLVRPAALAQALEIARDLFKEGKLSLVVLDILANPPPAKPRDFTALLRRLQEALVKSRSAALLLLPLSAPVYWQALDEYTHLRLRIERRGWLYQGRDIAGYRVQVTILKDKTQPGTRQSSFDLTFEDVVQGDGA